MFLGAIFAGSLTDPVETTGTPVLVIGAGRSRRVTGSVFLHKERFNLVARPQNDPVGLDCLYPPTSNPIADAQYLNTLVSGGAQMRDLLRVTNDDARQHDV